MRIRNLSLVLLVALVAAACGGSGDDPGNGGDGKASGGATPDSFATPFAGADAYPIFVSSEIVTGENRFLIGLLDSNDAPIGGPDIQVDVAFYDLDASTDEPVSSEATEFVWIVKEQNRGLYVAHPTFDHPGKWGAEVTITGNGLDETLRAGFDVAETSSTPAVGDEVPASDTPTADDVSSLKEISTDNDPDPRFYEMSIKEALNKGVPFVAVFATPKFCTSAVCGPTLDDVEAVAKDFPDITFIHTEIYEDNDPAKPPVPAVTEWGLPSEPWVFVVGSDGRLVAKFEGSAPASELRPVLEQLK